MGIMGFRRGLLYALFFADALRIGERLSNEYTFNNNLPTQIGDVIINPGNPVNPDSKCHETVTCYK